MLFGGIAADRYGPILVRLDLLLVYIHLVAHHGHCYVWSLLLLCQGMWTITTNKQYSIFAFLGDAYKSRTASAMSTNTLARSIFGFGFPLVGP